MKWHELIDFCKNCQDKYGDNAEAFILFENEEELEYGFFSDVKNPNNPVNDADRVMTVFLGLLTVEDNILLNSVICAAAMEAMENDNSLSRYARLFQKKFKERYSIETEGGAR